MKVKVSKSIIVVRVISTHLVARGDQQGYMVVLNNTINQPVNCHLLNMAFKNNVHHILSIITWDIHHIFSDDNEIKLEVCVRTIAKKFPNIKLCSYLIQHASKKTSRSIKAF